MTENVKTKSFSDEAGSSSKTVQLVDLPGHERLRVAGLLVSLFVFHPPNLCTFTNLFGSWHPYLAKIFGGTPSCFNRYKNQIIVAIDGIPGLALAHGTPAVLQGSRP